LIMNVYERVQMLLNPTQWIAPASSMPVSSPSRGARTVRATLMVLTIALVAPAGAAAQQPDGVPRGVQLKLVYETQFRPRLAVQPFAGSGAIVEEVHRIVQRDLDYSDRFDMLVSIPERLRTGSGEYAAWNALGVVYLVTGSVEASPGGYGLRLALHDVVYGSVKEIRHFSLPPMSDRDFRMAVHAAADEVVRWATGERGVAATRIALSRQLSDGTYELLVVDSDGENLRRLHAEERIYSPAWSPDGTRLAYNEADYTGHGRVVERNLATGAVRVLSERGVPAQTPTYSYDGRKLAMALWNSGGMAIYEYDVARNCCLSRISRRSRIDMNPSYSPDGRRLAFQSDRLGNPHIFIMPAGGGEAVLLTPFEQGGPAFFFGPDWSPTGSQIVFRPVARREPGDGRGCESSWRRGPADHERGSERGSKLGPERPACGVQRGARRWYGVVCYRRRHGPNPSVGHGWPLSHAGLVSGARGCGRADGAALNGT